MIATSIVEDGRMVGKMSGGKTKVVEMFRRRGAPPSKVAAAILDAVHTNPAVRTVGNDAWAVAALSRIAPYAWNRLAGSLQRRFAS